MAKTEVAIIIKDYDPTDKQQDELRALAEKLAPEFLAKVGATGKQFEIMVANRPNVGHPKRK